MKRITDLGSGNYEARVPIVKPHPALPDIVPIERMAAADVVINARQAATLAQSLSAEDCEAHAKRIDDLIAELDAARICFRKGRPTPPDPDWIPPFLRREEDAAFHE